MFYVLTFYDFDVYCRMRTLIRFKRIHKRLTESQMSCPKLSYKNKMKISNRLFTISSEYNHIKPKLNNIDVNGHILFIKQNEASGDIME